jgi:hypothetical protein
MDMHRFRVFPPITLGIFALLAAAGLALGIAVASGAFASSSERSSL